MFLWQALSDYMKQPSDILLGDLETNKKLLDLLKAGNKEAIISLNDKFVEQYLNNFKLFNKNFNFLKREDVNLLPILRKGFLKEVIKAAPPGATRINPFIQKIILALEVDSYVKVNWLRAAITSRNYELARWLIQKTAPNIDPSSSILEELLSKEDSGEELLQIAKLLKEYGVGFGNLSSEKRENFLEWEKTQSVRVKPVQTVSPSIGESKVSGVQDSSHRAIEGSKLGKSLR